MNMTKSLFFTAIISGALVGSVSAEELILTSQSQKSRQMVAMDMATDGRATGVQFKIALPEGVSAKSVDLSNCLADLPGSHQGNCVVLNDEILGLVYSDSNELLPAGVLSIGHIGFPAGSKKGDVRVTEFLVSDANAKPLPTSTKVVSDRAPLTDARENRVK